MLEFALLAIVFFTIMGALVDFGLALLVSPYVHSVAYRTARSAAVDPNIDSNFQGYENGAKTRIETDLGRLCRNVRVSINPAAPAGPRKIVSVRARGFYRYTFLRMLGFQAIEVDRTATILREAEL